MVVSPIFFAQECLLCLVVWVTPGSNIIILPPPCICLRARFGAKCPNEYLRERDTFSLVGLGEADGPHGITALVFMTFA